MFISDIGGMIDHMLIVYPAAPRILWFGWPLNPFDHVGMTICPRRSKSTRAVRRTKNNVVGDNVISHLPIGASSVAVEAAGFKKVVQDNITGPG
jgi:hypothetical protein